MSFVVTSLFVRRKVFLIALVRSEKFIPCFNRRRRGEALLTEKGEISSSVFFKMKKKSGQLNNVASSLIL